MPAKYFHLFSKERILTTKALHLECGLPWDIVSLSLEVRIQGRLLGQSSLVLPVIPSTDADSDYLSGLGTWGDFLQSSSYFYALPEFPQYSHTRMLF